MAEDASATGLPRWVPDGARRYLLHTEAGFAIRELARHAGCHASTILRQIRRMESRRDDPLVDAALTSLAESCFEGRAHGTGEVPVRAATQEEKTTAMYMQTPPCPEPPQASQLDREAVRVLRRLCESGAVLAVAENMEKAVVVRHEGTGAATRTAVVEAGVAQALALKDWIACPNPGRISRYYITASGRSALSRLVAEDENRARAKSESGFAEAQAAYGEGGSWTPRSDDADASRPRRVRYNMAESPLLALSRRRDRDGRPFIDDKLVRAGERLREDFELAQMGPRVAQDWDSFLTGGFKVEPTVTTDRRDGPSAARHRVARALADLGPGLSDVALRCCCYLEGLESAEQRLGWSARSGKIVLRIALQRLKQHYDGLSSSDRLIG